jgi:hypothetical protein
MTGKVHQSFIVYRFLIDLEDISREARMQQQRSLPILLVEVVPRILRAVEVNTTMRLSILMNFRLQCAYYFGAFFRVSSAGKRSA